MPITGGGGAAILDDLEDVILTAPATCNVLHYDTDHWENLDSTTDWLLQYLNLNGRTGGQRVGTNNHASGTIYDITLEGRLNLVSGSAPYVANTKLNLGGAMDTNALWNFIRCVPSVTFSGSSSATYRGMFLSVTGGSSISSGNPNFTGILCQVAPTTLSGLGTLIGLSQSVTVPPGNQSLTRLIASDNTIIGSSTYTATNDIVSATGFLETLTLNKSNYITLRAFELSTTVSSIFGVIGACRLFDFEQAFDTGSFSSSSTTGTLTNLSTNITAVGAGINNMRVGMLVTHANIPVGTFITLIDVGAATVSMSQAATGTVVGATIVYAGAVTVLSGMYKATNYPANVNISRVIDLQSEDMSQIYGYLYLRPPTPANYPVPTAYLHIGAGGTAVNTAPIKLTSGGPTTIPEAGTIEFLNERFYVTPTSLERQVIPGVLFTSTADGQVTNTLVENTLNGTGVGDTTLNANFFVAGKTVRIRATGILDTDAVPGTLQLRIRMGGVVILDTGAQAITANIAGRWWNIDAVITCRTVGVGGTVIGQTAFEHLTVAGQGFPTFWEATNLAPVVVNTTAALPILLTAQWSVASVNNVIICTNYIIEVLN